MSKQPSEHEEAVAFSQWMDSQGIHHWHVQQEGGQKVHMGVLMKQKREGKKRGLPDYIIYLSPEQSKVQKGCMVAVELKKQRTAKKNGELRALSSDGITIYPEQEDFFEKYNTVAGCQGTICFGAQESINYVKRFLK